MATYGSVAGVESLVPEMGTLSGTTTPTSAEVTTWLAQAHARINRAISNAGYTIPVSASALLYPELTGLENLYAAAYALRARGIDTASGEDEKASEVWLADFDAQLRDLAASNLALLGATVLTPPATSRRRRIRTIQMRKVDGYARGPVNSATAPTPGEYTGHVPPAE